MELLLVGLTTAGGSPRPFVDAVPPNEWPLRRRHGPAGNGISQKLVTISIPRVPAISGDHRIKDIPTVEAMPGRKLELMSVVPFVVETIQDHQAFAAQAVHLITSS
jgi:hypothetical protein